MIRFTRTVPLLAIAAVVSACHHGAKASGTSGGPMMAAAPAAPAMPAGVTPALIAQGDSLFAARSCQRCHGPKGTTGRNGPDLTQGPWLHGGRDYANLVRIITTGIPKDSLKDSTRPFAMNARGGGQPPLLTDDQVKAIAAYVWTISAAKTK